MGEGSERRRAALTLLSVGLLVVLRALQCSALGPLMYSQEWAQFGDLAADLASGRFDGSTSLRDLYRFYAYGDHAQGTLLISLLGVPLSWVFGPTSTALHAVAVGFEALLVGLAAWFLAGKGAVPWALGTAALLLPPLFVTVFQLMPYGNHTEFLWMPVLLGGLSAGRWSTRRLAALSIVAAVAVLFYRLNLAAVVALAGAVLLSGREGRARVVAWLAGGGVAGLALATVVSGDGGGVTFLPVVGFRLGDLGPTLSKVLGASWPGASLGGLAGTAALLASAGLWAAGLMTLRAERRSLLPWFAVLWAGLAFCAPVLSAAPSPEYLINAWYACLLTGLVALVGRSVWGRRMAAASLGVLIVISAPGDLRVAVGPRPSVDYDAVALHRGLALQTIDADDLPYWIALLEGGRGGRTAGEVTKIDGCARQHARELAFDGQGLRSSRCGRCATEGVPDLLAAQLDADPEFDPDIVGRALWIRCDRNLAEVRTAVQTLPKDVADALLRSAEDEARMQGGVSARR